MIEIGNLLDTCGISYTDKQLAKLDKLIKELLKKLCLQQYDSYKTPQNHSNPDYDGKFRNEDFANKAEIKTFQQYNEKFNFEPEPHCNNTITKEIKQEFYHEPYVSLEEFNNSEDVSDIVQERCNLKKKTRGKEITRNSIEIKEEFPNDPVAYLETTAKSFQSQPIPDLKKHVQNVHEGIKPFKCTICDYEFSKHSNLKKHIVSVHERIKPFKCNMCQYETAHRPHLKRHIQNVHEGIKEFKCTICDYETAQRVNLKAHIESVHEGIKRIKKGKHH